MIKITAVNRIRVWFTVVFLAFYMIRSAPVFAKMRYAVRRKAPSGV